MKNFLRVFCYNFLFFFVVCGQVFAGGVAIYGDSQHNEAIQEQVVLNILARRPAVVFRLGDLVDDGNNPKLWEVFNRIHGPLMQATQYYPALGNHEHDSPLYFKNFPFLRNRRWYSADYAGIHVIVLDSNSRLDAESPQFRWLKADLERIDAEARFIIAIFHHPLFDVSCAHQGDEKNIRTILLPLFKAYNVSAVFSGHSHDYQRFAYDGTYFVVSGGGGSHLYTRARDSEYLRVFTCAYHFCFLNVVGDALAVSVIDIDNKIIDEFTLPVRKTNG